MQMHTENSQSSDWLPRAHIFSSKRFALRFAWPNWKLVRQMKNIFCAVFLRVNNMRQKFLFFRSLLSDSTICVSDAHNLCTRASIFFAVFFLFLSLASARACVCVDLQFLLCSDTTWEIVRNLFQLYILIWMPLRAHLRYTCGTWNTSGGSCHSNYAPSCTNKMCIRALLCLNKYRFCHR